MLGECHSVSCSPCISSIGNLPVFRLVRVALSCSAHHRRGSSFIWRCSLGCLLRQRWPRPQSVRTFLVGLVAVTWLCWLFVPTTEFAVHVRFWLERSNYEKVVEQIARGEQPACLRTSECMVVGNGSPYVVFPFPGFLSAWIGVVHVPELGQAPDNEWLRSIASDPGCELTPIAPHYYVCGFY